MYLSTLQALTLLKEAGRIWNTWHSLDERSRIALKAEATELKEAMGEARKASLAAMQKTGSSLQKNGRNSRLAKAMSPSQEGGATGTSTLPEASLRLVRASRNLALHLREIEKQGTRVSTDPRAASETLDYPFVSPAGTGPDGAPFNSARNRVS